MLTKATTELSPRSTKPKKIASAASYALFDVSSATLVIPAKPNDGPGGLLAVKYQ